MDIAQRLALRLKELSVQQNKPINKMLSFCEVNKNFIYDLEHRGANPSVDKLIKIADYFDVSMDYLLGVESRPHDEFYVSEEEKQLINKYRALELDKRKAIETLLG